MKAAILRVTPEGKLSAMLEPPISQNVISQIFEQAWIFCQFFVWNLNCQEIWKKSYNTIRGSNYKFFQVLWYLELDHVYAYIFIEVALSTKVSFPSIIICVVE